ncbi:hypothetical protein H0H81_008807 [Sphagnurus paluster]|uniref:Uncharacterized protein n=1 Tax=Sphagnurus paluster TaxID=117069 RepID=A0A9P7K9A1_9AGAR|nr:hypothetical protein H0H81_008807 [Sphagnurus paluster]
MVSTYLRSIPSKIVLFTIRNNRLTKPLSFLLTTTSIAVSRVMLSIHSLAHKLGSDSAWLLNNVELSRVCWRRGAHEGELIIELDTIHSPDDEECDSYSISKGSVYSLKETRVGMYDERSW